MALTLQQLKNKVDAFMASFFDNFTVKQQQWIANHLGFWQGIGTPPQIPIDGVDTAPDLTLKPVNDPEGTSWFDFKANLPQTVPCSIQIVTHNGPSGNGFTATVFINMTSKIYQKSWGSGVYSDNSQIWSEVLQTPI